MIGDLATPEGLVRTAAGSAYLLDGPRAYRFRDCSQVVMWGADCATLPNITDAKLAGYANAGYLQYLILMPSGTTWLPQGGQLRQVLDPGILAVYGIPATTSPVYVGHRRKASGGRAGALGGPLFRRHRRARRRHAGRRVHAHVRADAWV